MSEEKREGGTQGENHGSQVSVITKIIRIVWSTEDTYITEIQLERFADSLTFLTITSFGLIGCLDISVSLPKQIVSRPSGWKIVKSLRGLCRQLIPFQEWCLFQRSKSLIESNKIEVQIVFVAGCSLVIEYDQNKSDLNI